MANLSSKTGTITTPVQTQISLANNATTSVQDMSAYDAQEVMGFVYVDATADLRAYFTVTVVKNGAGTYEIAGADVAGDQSGTGASAIAPVSFSMSGSILQATLPNISGFVSAYLRYQLSAPYLGGNYPLTVSARQVAGDVSGVAVPAGYIGETKQNTATGVNCPNNTLVEIVNTGLLNPGIYLISCGVTISTTNAGRSGTGSNKSFIYLATASASSSGTALGSTQMRTATPTLVNQAQNLNIPPQVIVVTSNTTYFCNLYVESSTAGDGTAPSAAGQITAIRIA